MSLNKINISHLLYIEMQWFISFIQFNLLLDRYGLVFILYIHSDICMSFTGIKCKQNKQKILQEIIWYHYHFFNLFAAILSG